ncbi:unnamed protein product [Ilex paraguariensis]|uniref:Uncharacterized protein n=1 Tax=Ilex paraguariensis TaxID=185542 RepID=A0ABC8S118_9AQUA
MYKTFNYSEQSESVSDMIFGFLDEGEGLTESSCDSSDGFGGSDSVEDEEVENPPNLEERKVFWETQEELLQATLCRTSSIESKVRYATEEALREISLGAGGCVCQRPVSDGCRDCIQREIMGRLQNEGYNCAICKSKWKSSPDIPSGEHTFLEVVHESSSKSGEVRVVIELNFRAEFEMARASEEYNRLINRLPEVFVGKVEKLRALIKILCSASKKCMEERKMHMAPWRKLKYMEAKWLGTYDRKTLVPISPVEQLNRSGKQRASRLTFDLLETSSGLHCPTIKVM